MSLHLASPVSHPDRIRAGIADLRAAFAIVVPYLVSIPLYGGLWMMACASARQAGIQWRRMSCPIGAAPSTRHSRSFSPGVNI